MEKEFIHFIGIGGIGVSALARFYKSRGFRVSGSDIARSEITDALKKEGIRVFISRHKAANIAPAVTKVIYTAAAKSDNPEIIEAKKRRIPAQNYAKALSEVTKQYKTIAIAGAHGKTTTTALVALTLIRAGLDPTVIIGSNLRQFKNSNFRRGRSQYFVLEADEYKGSFWSYSPAIAVVTNLDREHLDFYKNIANIKLAFLKFLLKLDIGGWAVLNGDDKHLKQIGKKLEKKRGDLKVGYFSLHQPQAKNIKKVLRIPGRHNVSNALAAHAVGKILGVSDKRILSALAAYRGAWRRFDYQGLFRGAKVFADYAHHPTEIKAVLEAAREKYPKSRIICVFQPHHYDRTERLFNEFASSFGAADELILLDIYEVAGREKKAARRKVSSSKLASAAAKKGVKARYAPSEKAMRNGLKSTLKKGDILLMMGAGSIWRMTKKLINPKNKI